MTHERRLAYLNLVHLSEDKVAALILFQRSRSASPPNRLNPPQTIEPHTQTSRRPLTRFEPVSLSDGTVSPARIMSTSGVGAFAKGSLSSA